MGLYDRDYLREEAQPGMQLRAPRSMVITIIIINVAVFLVNYVFTSDSDSIMYTLSANVYSLIHPWMWWQLVTSGFAHAPNDINHILFNMLGLYFLGQYVERLLGRWEFLRFYLTAIVVGCVVHLARVYLTVPEVLGPNGAAALNPMVNPWAVPLLGASAGVTATVMLFIFNFPKVKLLLFFAIPVPAWLVGVLVVVSDMMGAGLFKSIFGDGVMSANVAYDAHLAGALFALAYFFFKLNFGHLLPGGGTPGDWSKIFQRRPNLRVHAPDEDRTDNSRHSEEDAEADRILIKIDREGIESLTPRERKIMDDYSRRMQQKHR